MFQFIKKRRASLAMIGLLAGISSSAFGDEVFVSGSTLGSFNGGPFLANDGIFSLVYSNSIFSNTTVGGFLDLGGNPAPGANLDNLGSFSLANVDQDYNGNTFNLMVTFSAPTTIVGGATATFTDVILGTVLAGSGGVFIDFDNSVQTFHFSNPTASGSFTMFVNDVSIAPGQMASLTGRISGSQAPVPEPASLVALAIGGLGLMRLRHRSTKSR